MAVGGTANLGVGGCLADKLVEIGSTVAIADSIVLGLVSVPKAELQDYMAADTEDSEDTPFAPGVAAGKLLVMLAHDQDVAYNDVG